MEPGARNQENGGSMKRDLVFWWSLIAGVALFYFMLGYVVGIGVGLFR